METQRWLLLLHQIPPKPAYFRAKVLRRLSQIGALAIKNAAYLLPQGGTTLEDFQWIRQEIEQQGGAAWLFQVDFLSGVSPEQIEQSFRDLHHAEYEEMIEQAQDLLRQASPSAAEETLGSHRKLVRRNQELGRIDFFQAPIRRRLDTLLQEIEQRLHTPDAAASAMPFFKPGRVWVTRKGVHVDRIASAWLIKRFIDAEARFRMVDALQYVHQPDEIRFDMFGGEFTHIGDLCTFEVLINAYNLRADAGLAAIAEVIHDIDLKDSHYQREETAGVARLIEGLCARAGSDEARLEQGGLILESLYQSYCEQ